MAEYIFVIKGYAVRSSNGFDTAIQHTAAAVRLTQSVDSQVRLKSADVMK